MDRRHTLFHPYRVRASHPGPPGQQGKENQQQRAAQGRGRGAPGSRRALSGCYRIEGRQILIPLVHGRQQRRLLFVCQRALQQSFRIIQPPQPGPLGCHLSGHNFSGRLIGSRRCGAFIGEGQRFSLCQGGSVALANGQHAFGVTPAEDGRSFAPLYWVQSQALHPFQTLQQIVGLGALVLLHHGHRQGCRSGISGNMAGYCAAEQRHGTQNRHAQKTAGHGPAFQGRWSSPSARRQRELPPRPASPVHRQTALQPLPGPQQPAHSQGQGPQQGRGGARLQAHGQLIGQRQPRRAMEPVWQQGQGIDRTASQQIQQQKHIATPLRCRAVLGRHCQYQQHAPSPYIHQEHS